MKIKLGKPMVVMQGCHPEESMWSIYQFPTIQKDGEELIVGVNVAQDIISEVDDVNGRIYYSSKDNGTTWEKISSKRVHNISATTKNGDKISVGIESGIDVSGYKKNKYIYQMLPGEKKEKAKPGCLPIAAGECVEHGSEDWVTFHYTFDNELLPDDLKIDSIKILRLKNGESEFREENAKINWKHMPRDAYQFKNFKEIWLAKKPTFFFANGLSPNGEIWAVACTGSSLDPETVRYNPYSAAHILVSDDDGKTFNLRAVIQYHPDDIDDNDAYMFGGWNEAALTFANDGSAIMLMRVNDVNKRGRAWSPMYFTRSTDGGYHWSKPSKFDDLGVLPSMCKLNCGAILAIYGRPGIFLRGTNDKSGEKWEMPIEIMTPNDRSEKMSYFDDCQPFHKYVGSCCNCSIVATGDNTAMIAYSDFYYPDLNDEKLMRKTILVQSVTVEMN